MNEEAISVDEADRIAARENRVREMEILASQGRDLWTSEQVSAPIKASPRCPDCLVYLPHRRRCGRCESCQQNRRREIRRPYMREYQRRRRLEQRKVTE